MNKPSYKWVGVKWHNLTVLDEEASRPEFVVCVCNCGNKIEVPFESFKRGQIRSCGCEKELPMDDKAAFEKLLKTAGKLVGCMKGRGGTPVCEDWMESRLLFVDWARKNGYRPGLRLTRIDKSDGFSPANCCWARANGAVGYVAVQKELCPVPDYEEPLNENVIHVPIRGGEPIAYRGTEEKGYKFADPWDEIPMHDLTEREISKYFLEV